MYTTQRPVARLCWTFSRGGFRACTRPPDPDLLAALAIFTTTFLDYFPLSYLSLSLLFFPYQEETYYTDFFSLFFFFCFLLFVVVVQRLSGQLL